MLLLMLLRPQQHHHHLHRCQHQLLLAQLAQACEEPTQGLSQHPDAPATRPACAHPLPPVLTPLLQGRQQHLQTACRMAAETLLMPPTVADCCC